MSATPVMCTAFETLLARASAGHYPSKKLKMILMGNEVIARDSVFEDKWALTRYEIILKRLLELTAVDPGMTILSLGSGLCYYPLEMSDYHGLWVDVDLPKMIAIRELCGTRRPNSVNIPCDVRDISSFEGNYRVPYLGARAIVRLVPDVVLIEGLLMYLPRATAATLLGTRTICDVVGVNRVEPNPNHLWRYDPVQEISHIFSPMFRVLSRQLVSEPTRDQYLLEVQNDR